MKLEERIILLSQLGETINQNIDSEEFQALCAYAKTKNHWFTQDNVRTSIKAVTQSYLNPKALEQFVQEYPQKFFNPSEPQNIGIVAAGNIPLVGLQDLIHVFLSGNIAHFKPSSQDEVLMSYFIRKMHEINPESKEFIRVADKLNNLDAYIATGSGNTSRYFEYYFGNKPNIIRKNRISVAILDGSETKTQLSDLGTDILQYFGLGCRNVSKLFVPKGYNFTPFFEAIEYWNSINLHSKYVNNYDYNKSIMLVNGDKHLDNGFLLLKESTELHSPISTVFYEEYENVDEILQKLENHKEMLQCIVGQNFIPFGGAQAPKLNDYADGVDTLAFLYQLHNTSL